MFSLKLCRRSDPQFRFPEVT